MSASDRLLLHTDAYQPLCVRADTFIGLLDHIWQLSPGPATYLVHAGVQNSSCFALLICVHAPVIYTYAFAPTFSDNKPQILIYDLLSNSTAEWSLRVVSLSHINTMWRERMSGEKSTEYVVLQLLQCLACTTLVQKSGTLCVDCLPCFMKRLLYIRLSLVL